jgi:hypothetical protein
MSKLCQALALLGLLACVPARAVAAPIVNLTAALTPERLGLGTTIAFVFSIKFPAERFPVPLTEVQLRYPANLGVATSGLGVSTCRPAVLETQGPPGCPLDSVMGYGSALVEVPFGSEVLHERVRSTVFMAPVEEGHLALIFYAVGESPVAAQLVFPGSVLPAAYPFGGNLVTTLPLVPSVPEAPDVAILRLTTTLGPSGITYYEYARGRKIPYHPRGILLPRSCPDSGFQFAGRFVFEDGSEAQATTVVPCPRGKPAPRRLPRCAREMRRQLANLGACSRP